MMYIKPMTEVFKTQLPDMLVSSCICPKCNCDKNHQHWGHCKCDKRHTIWEEDY